MDPDQLRHSPDLVTLCRSLEANADEVAARVIHHWGTIGRAEPWLKLPPDVSFDHLPQLIRALAAAALCTEYDRDLCRRVVELSATHGQHRFAEGFGETLLYREYHLLRRALWKRMKEEQGENASVYYATMRVDALISLANAAALHGLHKVELEREGRWPDVLEEFLEEWPLPQL